MGLKITINPNDEVRGMTLTEMENIIFLLTREENVYSSYFIYACRDRRDGEKFIGNAGALKNTEWDDALSDDLPENVDIYICPNGMTTPSHRTKDNLINIQNLIIDIDAHNANMTIEELNNHINKFKTQLMEKLNIKPNFIHHTGRGLHLWYCIEALHCSLDFVALSVIDMLCKDIENIMKELNENILAVDKASSSKLNGLFRLPYTYNTSAKLWSSGEMIHQNIPNVNVLKDKLLQMGYHSNNWKSKKEIEHKRDNAIQKAYNESETKKKQKQSTIDPEADYGPCINHRLEFMNWLFENNHVEKGRRDVVLFALYATLIAKYNINDSWNTLCQYNNMINIPMTQTELAAICKEVEKKRHKFKNYKFLRFIEATEEELNEFYKNSSKNKRIKKREAKAAKYHKVVELFLNGYNKTEIAKELNLSRPTVRKIIRESL